MKTGDIVRQKVTGWKVVLLEQTWRIDRLAGNGDWKGKVWVEEGDGGHWEKDDFFESELESI